MSSRAPLRVVQWATGSIGIEAVRSVLDHPDLELAGALVYSGDKEGRDAGELAGRGPAGVRCTRDVEAVLALGADCVSYMPRTPSLAEVCRILRSGANVVTTSFLFHPAACPEPDRQALAEACAAGGTSVHGTGLNPGPVSGLLPLATTALSRRIDHVLIQERADWSLWESVEITFDAMRFGSPPDRVGEDAGDFLAFNSGLFKEEVRLVADTLDAGIDEVTTDLDLVLAEQDVTVLDRVLRAGTVGGQRWTWTGRRAGEPLVRIEALWTVGIPYPGGWPAPQVGWTVTIEGEPSIRTHLLTLASYERRLPLAEHTRAANVATASAAVNAIPAVCAARPGPCTAADLPLIRSGLGLGRT